MSSTPSTSPISRTPAIPGAYSPESRGKAAASRNDDAPRSADARLQLNAEIVAQSLDVSIRSGNEPLALLYRTAIDRLNELLAPEFGDNAIQTAASQDQSPEAVAGRIVSLSTGFFSAYQAQHPDEDVATQLNNFMALIRKGFEQGYADASNILDGLGVLNGDISAGIQRTYDLVLKGYDDFAAGVTSASSPASGSA